MIATCAFKVSARARFDTHSRRAIHPVAKPPATLAYDAAGNTTSDGSYTLGYNLRGRLASVAISTNQSTYSHDNAGQRVRKFSNSGANSTVLYNYDLNGHLLGEYDQNGNPIREYLWLDDQPVAVFTPDTSKGASTNTNSASTAAPLVYYIFADHLNTPRAVVDSQNKLRWSWLDEPFGTTPAISNPTGVGAFIMSLRFPGQVYDAESGLHYNVNRDYVPGIGRYAQSDPIGLNGGVNTFGYVGGNPLSFSDPRGLDNPSMGPYGPGPNNYGRNTTSQVQVQQAWDDFQRNYADMRKANTIGGDKYFHCMANCQATRQGRSGEAAACMISDVREWTDQNIKGDTASASLADQAANAVGRSGALSSSQSCRAVCSGFRPNGLPSRY